MPPCNSGIFTSSSGCIKHTMYMNRIWRAKWNSSLHDLASSHTKKVCTGNSTIHVGTFDVDAGRHRHGVDRFVVWRLLEQDTYNVPGQMQHTSSFLGPHYFGVRALTLSRQRSESVGGGQKVAEENDGSRLQLFSKVQTLISPFSLPPQVPERIYDSTRELLSHPLDSSRYHDNVCHLTLFSVIWQSPSSSCFSLPFPLVTSLQEEPKICHPDICQLILLNVIWQFPLHFRFLSLLLSGLR